MSRQRPTRRHVLGLFASGTAIAVAGCNGLGEDSDPAYEAGDVGDVDGDDRSPEEMVAAEALAQQEGHESVTPLESLSLVDHEFVLEDDYRGATVQGRAENVGDDRIQVVEVRVRVYDDAGDQLGRYLDTTGDLDAGDQWAFEVILLESPADVGRYDVAVVGTPT
ncbi:FxLYD domain-containing protein [Natrarchaeobius sp. A-rgal3]|uniref:FxLYD domain-containing protein n=1 Tax=Natrarchaeobius versutus TaxID=1679078 RepID=UPI0035108743